MTGGEEAMKKIAVKKKNIPKTIRVAVTAILSIILLFSIYSLYAASQLPQTTKETITTCEYSHNGYFNYVVYLKNNSVYNTSILYPGQGAIFKKITDHINGSFTYQFQCNTPATTQGSYTVVAQIQTDLWEKEFSIVPTTSFNATNASTSFTTTFPIDFTRFENVVNEINEETGVTAGDPTLRIICTVHLFAETEQGDIIDSFAPFLSIPLGGNIIEIGGSLSQSKAGSLEETRDVVQPEVVTQRNTWFIIALVVIITLSMFLLLTKTKSTEATEKLLKKIHKKYGEWIVDVEKPLKRSLGAEVVSMKSLEDLVKVSEELGKPILHYTASTGSSKQHLFYVLDENTQYEYIL